MYDHYTKHSKATHLGPDQTIPRIRAVVDFDMLTGPVTARDLSCVEIGDSVCTDAHMEFDLIYVHFLRTAD